MQPFATLRNACPRALRSLALGAFLLAALGSLATFPAHGADTVLTWNQIMQTTVASGNANVQARSGAIVQLAVFEAVNSIIGDYEPYLGVIAAPPGASPDAATIAAAHRTLVTLHGGSAATLNALRASALDTIPDGPAKEDGIAVGEAAAAALLLLRANDGAAQAGTTPYTPGTNPGDWQPAPPAFAPAALPGWGLVAPFGLEEGSQFRSPPPPGLRTGKYAHDYNEVKLVGKSDSAFRPQDRTDVARFFAAASPIQTWNPAARQASLAQGKTLSENARIFALLAMAMCDASIATYESKYFYNLWRPLTAIRGGDTDQNHQTDPNATWSPLLTTPAFPSYPSAHATLSGAARRVLERVFGKQDHTITLTNPTLGLTLNYTAFKQICDDIDDARVFGGIHFRFDQEAGARQGKDVGNYVLDNCLRSPLDEGDLEAED